jgi:dihydrofolate reductase
MRTLIVSEFITLDGVVEAPGGESSHPHGGWTVPYGTDDLFAYKLQETLEAESLLLGRVTFESFAQVWPERNTEFANKMNAMPKRVVTTSGNELGWNGTAITGDIPAEVRKLKQGDGGPILVAGSATLVRMLLAAGLVDELRLMVYPILIGGGLTIFPAQRNKLELQLAELVRFDTGVVLHVYRCAV